MARFEIYRRGDGDWGWRLKSADGDLVAIAGEGFVTVASAHTAIEELRRELSDAQVVELE